jgi:hypothetical protein
MMFIHVEDMFAATTNYINNEYKIQVTTTLHKCAVPTYIDSFMAV